MIILDIETSGLNPVTHGVLSLGAVDFDSGQEFYGECFLRDGKIADPKALEVNGFTEEQIRDENKMSDLELYLAFIMWVKVNNYVPLLAGQQVGSFDIKFLQEIHETYCKSDKWIFGHRSVDLHSVAYGRYSKSLSLDEILIHCKLTPEPKPHNALTGARLERDCFKKFLI